MKRYLRLFKPFETLRDSSRTIILTSWLAIICIGWLISSFIGQTHLFPTPQQVFSGLSDLWFEGIVTHIFSSLWLCAQAVFLSILISLAFAYSTAIPFFKPIGMFISKLRYLPLTGISFYISIMIHDARNLQVWVLVVFMTTFLITSIVQMIQDIPQEEFDHARTLGCNRWEVLWEVVIKGRIDYIFELVRQNLAIVWMMLVTVESILAAAGGLGFLIKNGDRLGNNGKVIALQTIIVIIGVSLDWLITKIRRIAFRYSNY